MEVKLIAHITAAIREATRQSFQLANPSRPPLVRGGASPPDKGGGGVEPLGGGCINEAYRLEGTDGSRYFLKLNDAQHLPMFIAEAEGLNAIAATNTIRIPRPIAHGVAAGQSYLVLEHLDLSSHGDAYLLGEQLAALHRCSATQLGFMQDNFIGTTPQPNGWKDSWIDFWRERGLGFQLRLAGENGFGGQLQRLAE